MKSCALRLSHSGHWPQALMLAECRPTLPQGQAGSAALPYRDHLSPGAGSPGGSRARSRECPSACRRWRLRAIPELRDIYFDSARRRSGRATEDLEGERGVVARIQATSY
jgi:hypothetical protein